MVDTIRGRVGSNQFDVTGQRPFNWREQTLLNYPNGDTPLYALTSRMSERSVDDPQFNWFTQEYPARRVQLTAALLSVPAGTVETINVVDCAFQFKQGDQLLFEATNEIVRIAADPVSDTALSVIRSYPEAATVPLPNAPALDPTAASINPFVRFIGSAYREGSLSPLAVGLQPTQYVNYTQIFRDTLAMTNTAEQVRLRTGDQVAKFKKEAFEKHRHGIEMAMLFGRPSLQFEAGQPIRTTGGVEYWIETGAPNNVIDRAGAPTDLQTLEGIYEQFSRFGNTQKVVLCGNEYLLAQQQILRKNADVNYDAKAISVYGLIGQQLRIGGGVFNFLRHPLFQQITSGTNPTAGGDYTSLASYAFVLDMDKLKYVCLNGRDTKYETKYEENGEDSMKSGYLTECGLELHHPNNHGLIKGLTRAAVDV